ncbi:hypothetical protein ES703_18808 [subsurface metagenome]
MDKLELVDLNQLVHDITNKCTSELMQKRETQILSRLKECGFGFKNEQEFKEFVKNKCKLKISGKLNELFVDNKLITKWWDTIDVDIKNNKVYAIAGNEPDNFND